MKKISIAQKKLIYVLVTMLVVYVLFWIFIYLPQARKLAVINKQLSSVEAQISEINQIIGGRSLEQALQDLDLEFKKVSARFPLIQNTG